MPAIRPKVPEAGSMEPGKGGVAAACVRCDWKRVLQPLQHCLPPSRRTAFDVTRCPFPFELQSNHRQHTDLGPEEEESARRRTYFWGCVLLVASGVFFVTSL